MLALSGEGPRARQERRDRAGLALLDESGASAVSGELNPYYTGLVYCITISSCQDLGDYRRAAEWTEAANRWCDLPRRHRIPRRLSHPPRGDHAASR